MALTLVTAPAAEPVTLAQLWAHLRIDSTGSPETSEFDDELELKLQAVRQELDGRDGWLGRALITQTWDLTLDRFPTKDTIAVPLPPLQSVTSVKYFDVDGVEQTLDASEYTVDAASQPGRIVIGDNGWPSIDDRVNAVTIRFVAGFGDAATDIPYDIRAGILLKVEALFDRSKNMDALKQCADNLLIKHRLPSF